MKTLSDWFFSLSLSSFAVFLLTALLVPVANAATGTVSIYVHKYPTPAASSCTLSSISTSSSQSVQAITLYKSPQEYGVAARFSEGNTNSPTTYFSFSFTNYLADGTSMASSARWSARKNYYVFIDKGPYSSGNIPCPFKTLLPFVNGLTHHLSFSHFFFCWRCMFVLN